MKQEKHDWRTDFMQDFNYFNSDLFEEINETVGGIIKKAIDNTAEYRLDKEKGYINDEEKAELFEQILEKWLKFQS